MARDCVRLPRISVHVAGLALVFALVAGAAASCDAKKDTDAGSQDSAAAPATSTAIAVPPPPPIIWGTCAPDGYNGEEYPDGAECGTLEVPVDYAKLDGPKAHLALIRFKATGDKIGSLVVNPGGPGASGVEFGADDEEYLTKPLLERFDRIGFDPRGVGGSTPTIKCDSDEDFDRARADAGVIVTAADADRENQETQEFVQRCVDKTGKEFLANVGTNNVVKDLDQLRIALGDAKLTYLGYSYGTKIGSQYAEAFPQNVRAMVLDGAMDPSAGAIDSLVDQSISFQTVFNDYAVDCAARPRCPLGSDPAKAVAVFHQLVDPLVRKPAPTADPRGLTHQDALIGTTDALYDDDNWPKLTEGLQALAGGGPADELLPSPTSTTNAMRKATTPTPTTRSSRSTASTTSIPKSLRSIRISTSGSEMQCRTRHLGPTRANRDSLAATGTCRRTLVPSGPCRRRLNRTVHPLPACPRFW